MLAGNDLYQALAEAASGLSFISETDSEIRPIFRKADGYLMPLEFIAIKASTIPEEIEVRPPGEFFERLTRICDWHGPEERHRADRFRELEKMITDNIRDAMYFRAGRINVKIFVLGRDQDGNIAGIETAAVET
jgi:hypothetical protein